MRSAILLAALLATGDLRADPASFEVRGSELVVSVDGRVLARSELIGAVLALIQENGRAADVRIDRIVTDPGRPEGDVVLYDLSVPGAGGAWTPACPAEPDGQPHAVLQQRANGAIAILCTAGARGKCVRLGYRPWAVRDGASLAPHWSACIHMIRADYCGDSQSTTREGMLVSIYDDLGIQRRDAEAGFEFEAAWGQDGALCVAHPRVPQNVSLDALAVECPRLAGTLGPSCTEEASRRLGAPLIFNASRGDGVPEHGR